MSDDEIITRLDAFPRRKDGQFDRRFRNVPTTQDCRDYNAAAPKGHDRYFWIMADFREAVKKAMLSVR